MRTPILFDQIKAIQVFVDSEAKELISCIICGFSLFILLLYLLLKELILTLNNPGPNGNEDKKA